jgi:hypothetical protein
MHVGVHQTITSLIATMEADEALRFLYVHEQVTNRRLAYGETISLCRCLTGIGMTSLMFAEALIFTVGVAASISPLVWDSSVDTFHIVTEKLMSDFLFPFVKTDFYLMSAQKRRSLHQELQGVVPSSRRILLSSKSEMKSVVGPDAIDPIEQNLAGLLGCPRILTEYLKILVTQVYEDTRIPFEARHPLNRSTKREVLDWIGENWERLGQGFTTFATSQPTARVGHCGEQSKEV